MFFKNTNTFFIYICCKYHAHFDYCDEVHTIISHLDMGLSDYQNAKKFSLVYLLPIQLYAAQVDVSRLFKIIEQGKLNMLFITIVKTVSTWSKIVGWLFNSNEKKDLTKLKDLLVNIKIFRNMQSYL